MNYEHSCNVIGQNQFIQTVCCVFNRDSQVGVKTAQMLGILSHLDSPLLLPVREKNEEYDALLRLIQAVLQHVKTLISQIVLRFQ